MLAYNQRSPNEERIWVSKLLSRDHKPSIKEEAERIIESKGLIKPFYNHQTNQPLGPPRVWLKDNPKLPGLAMSRSIGDMVAG